MLSSSYRNTADEENNIAGYSLLLSHLPSGRTLRDRRGILRYVLVPTALSHVLRRASQWSDLDLKPIIIPELSCLG